MVLKVLVMVLVASVEGTFQLCANPADFQPNKPVKYLCSGIANGKCNDQTFDSPGWETDDTGACTLEKKLPSDKPDEQCTAAGGTPTVSMTCGQMVTALLSTYSTETKAKCREMVADPPMTVSQLSFYGGGIFGCCGGTISNPKDKCRTLDPPMQMCAAGSTLQEEKVFEVKCKGIAFGQCGQTDSAESATRTGFEWESSDNICKIKYMLLTDAEKAANVDLKKKCTDAGGKVLELSWCGEMTTMFGIPNAGKILSKAECDKMWTPPSGGAGNTMKFYTGYFGNMGGCCAGASMSTPKDICSQWSQPTFRLCKNHSKYLPHRPWLITCYGLNAESCTGPGFQVKDTKVCEVQSQMAGDDVHAKCTAKGGTPVTRNTCGMINDGLFPNLKATKAVCSATNTKWAPQVQTTNAVVNMQLTTTFGCCGTGADNGDCCSASDCDGTIPLPPPKPTQTSPCAPRGASAIVFVLGVLTSLMM